MAKKTTYHHGDLRKALVDAAAALAAERGPEFVSLREVAKRARVTHAAPYHHFTGKAELLHAVALEGFRLMDVEMQKAYRSKRHRTPQDRLEALGHAYIRFAAKYPHYFKAMFRGVTPNAAFPDPEQHGQKNFQGLVLAVQSCLGETGPPSKNTLNRVLAAWAIVHGMASLWVERGFADTPYEGLPVGTLANMAISVSRTVFSSSASQRG